MLLSLPVHLTFSARPLIMIASQQRAFATIRCSISCVLNVAPPALKSAVQILGSKQIEMPATDILVDRDLAIIAAARMF